jgi:hypothetical protein
MFLQISIDLVLRQKSDLGSNCFDCGPAVQSEGGYFDLVPLGTRLRGTRKLDFRIAPEANFENERLVSEFNLIEPAESEDTANIAAKRT